MLLQIRRIILHGQFYRREQSQQTGSENNYCDDDSKQESSILVVPVPLPGLVTLFYVTPVARALFHPRTSPQTQNY